MLAKLLVSPNLDTLKAQIAQILTKHNLKQAHPDVLYLEAGEKLGVETAKRVREHLKLKPAMGNLKAIVMEQAEDLTPEAQNALLKTLEEPPGDALIIMGTTSEIKLLPTVLSRCEIAQLSPDQVLSMQGYAEDIEKLLKSTLEERFVYIEKLEDREGFLMAFINYFRAKPSGGQFLQDLLQAQIWANQNVNIRAVLEYLMLRLPDTILAK